MSNVLAFVTIENRNCSSDFLITNITVIEEVVVIVIVVLLLHRSPELVPVLGAVKPVPEQARGAPAQQVNGNMAVHLQAAQNRRSAWLAASAAQTGSTSFAPTCFGTGP